MHSVSHWNLLPNSFCGASHQSPINIDTLHVVSDNQLNTFTFKNFDMKNTIKYITNTGHTGLTSLMLWAKIYRLIHDLLNPKIHQCSNIQTKGNVHACITFIYASCSYSTSVTCVLKDDMVEVSGGGLRDVYSTLQLHFHWGTSQSSGSEHTVDGKRYQMEVGTVYYSF